MGVVFRAHDERLERDVALKVLPAGLLDDEGARKRFRQEALAVSKLNHPNIETVHDFDTKEGMDVLVMELIPGLSLDDKLAAGPLPEKEIANLGQQLAQGLAAAHEHGVVHRDLKPSNLRVTPDGRLKILDFGLAKFARPAGPAEATATMSRTRGVAGTLPYMSPEQLHGEELDPRMDLWGAGVALYEMATARRPFRAELPAQLTDQILHQPPVSPRALNPKTSPEMERIILKCLEKEPENRYQSAKELAVDLRRLGSVASSSQVITATMPAAPRRSTWTYLAVVVAVLLLAAVGLWLWRGRTASVAPQQYVQLTNFADSATSPALSPDGRMLAFIRGPRTFVGPGQIYIKLLPDGEPVQLTHDQFKKMGPVFSPDGSRVAYTAAQGWRWDTWQVPVLGGEPKLMLPNSSALTWTDNGRVMFSEITTGLYMKIVTSTESRAEERDVYRPPNVEIGMAHRSYLSPDRQWVLVGEMDNHGWLPCRLVPFDGGSAGKAVGPAQAECTSAAWSPDGKWMYFSANAGGGFHIWRQRFPDGSPEQITSGATQEEGIAMAPDGRSLVTSVGNEQSTVWLHDAQGDRQVSSEGYAVTPAVSPDGKKVYYLVRSQATRAFVTGDLWVWDASTGNSEKLLPGFQVSRFDISRDGKQIVFAATDADGKSSLWLAPLDRRSSPRRLTSDEAYRPFFGPQGDIFYLGKEGDNDFIYRMQADGTQRTKVLEQPVLYLLALSPDGQWLLAWLPEHGPEKPQAVVAYPVRGGPGVTLCTGCGTGPSNDGAPLVAWSPDQKYLYVGSRTRGNRGMNVPQTILLPLSAGETMPKLPPGFNFYDPEVVRRPGVKVISQPDIFPGPNPSAYAYMKMTAQRNLYRIQLP
jgi:Tol biopolymer transport system component